ncbi:IS30 family transposase, partial [Lactobacillus amylovorus]|uniref:IS30 family transposase n=1 Tax=Lactobacillus amylovorus TaxID=1604 RepID=UPI00232EA052
ITTDNGSEFADLANLEQVSKTLVYPYTSCDKGTVERHNGLIRRFIPKGDYINNYSLQDIINIETWCNSLPR